MKKIYFVLFLLSCFGCTSYLITSNPEDAAIRYKNARRTYVKFLPHHTPCKVRKGIEWPYLYNNVAVEWPDGTFSDWRHLDRDQHFEIAEAPVTKAPVYAFFKHSNYNGDVFVHSIDGKSLGIFHKTRRAISVGSHTVTASLSSKSLRSESVTRNFTAKAGLTYAISGHTDVMRGKWWFSIIEKSAGELTPRP